MGLVTQALPSCLGRQPILRDRPARPGGSGFVGLGRAQAVPGAPPPKRRGARATGLLTPAPHNQKLGSVRGEGRGHLEG